MTLESVTKTRPAGMGVYPSCEDGLPPVTGHPGLGVPARRRDDDKRASSRPGSRVDLSVVCPLHNEAAQAKRCYEHLTQALRGQVERSEIIFIDDGSSDDTQRVLTDACGGDARVRIVRLARNIGQQRATLVGLRHARGDVVVTLDADLKVEPSDLAALLRILRDDPRCDVASGRRTMRASGIVRRAASHGVTRLLNRWSGTSLKDPGSTFKAMRRGVVEQALRNEILAQNLPLFISYAGFDVREVPVTSRPSSGRRSRYRWSSLMMALALATLNYSSGARMLSAMLLIGSGLSVLGLVLGLFLFIKGTITQTALPTNLLLASILGMLFGGQFIAFSFMGYKLESLIRNLDLRATPMGSDGGES